jgi:hypothetical protein
MGAPARAGARSLIARKAASSSREARHSALVARLRQARVRGRSADWSVISLVLGGGLAVLGLMLIGLAWLGASNTPILQEQMAYLISGGVFGLGLVVLGGFLYFSHWQARAVQEAHQQTRHLASLAQTIEGLRSEMARYREDSRPTSVGLRDSSSPDLVVTANGTMAHLRNCPVVQGRDDLRTPSDVELAALEACGICNPYG